MSLTRKLAVAAALTLSSVPVLGQDGIAIRKWPPFQVFSMTGEGIRIVRAEGLAFGPTRDYRALWVDPAIKDFIGLSENEWDFSKPDGVPGFGPLPNGGNR